MTKPVTVTAINDVPVQNAGVDKEEVKALVKHIAKRAALTVGIVVAASAAIIVAGKALDKHYANM